MPNSDRLYSLVDLQGDEQQLAAPVPQEWINKLIPCIYKYDERSPPTPEFAGLIGDLPLLLALAAFSAPPEQLNSVLTQNIQPGVWLPHTHRHGCKISDSLIDLKANSGKMVVNVEWSLLFSVIPSTSQDLPLDDLRILREAHMDLSMEKPAQFLI